MQSPDKGSAEDSGKAARRIRDIVIKAFTYASDLDQLKSGSFKIFIKTEATVDVHEYVISSQCRLPRCIRRESNVTYLRGLCTVVRPMKMGTCQSLDWWDEQQFDTHAFFYSRPVKGIARTKEL